MIGMNNTKIKGPTALGFMQSKLLRKTAVPAVACLSLFVNGCNDGSRTVIQRSEPMTHNAELVRKDHVTPINWGPFHRDEHLYLKFTYGDGFNVQVDCTNWPQPWTNLVVGDEVSITYQALEKARFYGTNQDPVSVSFYGYDVQLIDKLHPGR